MQHPNEHQWTTVIRPRTGWFDIDLKELWRYRDLVLLFTKRNFAILYKQTILGPLWILLNPLITTVLFNVIFGGIAGLPTEGAPSFLFIMAGNTIWSMFAACINNTANTFVVNASTFGKVYFPRLTIPLSQALTAVINFLVQFAMFACFWTFFALNPSGAGQVQLTGWVLYLPILVVQVMVLGLAVGIIVSSLTTKYRDLAIAVTFAVQLWMYATPVVYSTTSLANQPVLQKLVYLNPMTAPVQVFRKAVLGCGQVDPAGLVYSLVCTLVLLAIGVILFSRIEKTFMDTV
ncbi:MAG: ABC transporter permease [Candidatus Fournierella pullistercoris]|uniref:Transport permease protein n=1 Tax=Candidatus Allofournierella pullistercoris TaxID=2838597 RepID=A0A948T289_9FIRM|nr:ABC transporter permease [Candidatus Fournierella pullistercoris]